MSKDYLDHEMYKHIVSAFNFNDINEIRMRVNQNLIVVVKNKKYFVKDDNGDFIKISKFDLENFIRRASQNSLYAYNDSIINGYITLPKGIRVGLSGEVVSENGQVMTIKNFSSLSIRIPHIIKNCSLPVYDFLVKGGDVKNTLIVSSPGAGKTTFLRDLIFQFYTHNFSKNVLLVDERNEITNMNDSEISYDLGCFVDIYTNCSKSFAFKNGIRSMRPEIIVVDELDLEKDLAGLINAMNSGVTVIATIHAKDINQLKRKTGFDEILNQRYFQRFVVLNEDNGPGTLEGVYDERLNYIFSGGL